MQVMKEDDNNWPAPDRVGRQELEVIVGDEHTSYTCTKLGSVLQVQQSKDPEGLRIFYYLVQVCAGACGPSHACGLGSHDRSFLHAGSCCFAHSALGLHGPNRTDQARTYFAHQYGELARLDVQLLPFIPLSSINLSSSNHQDLKCFVFSIISAHFKIQPISVSPKMMGGRVIWTLAWKPGRQSTIHAGQLDSIGIAW